MGRGMTMKTLFGAVAGALALGAVLVSYDLGERHTFSRDLAGMPAGYQQMADPYLFQAGQTGYVSPYGPYAAQNPYGVVTPAGYAAPQYANERVATAQPAVRRVSSQRTYSSGASERVATPKRTWQKSALLIGGSAAGGAGGRADRRQEGRGHRRAARRRLGGHLRPGQTALN